MTNRAGRFAGRSLAGFAVVGAGGVVFALLTLLVRAHFGPLYTVDQGVAVRLNHAVARHPLLVRILTLVTQLGARQQLIGIVAVVVIGLLIRRQHRLALYLVITGLGSVILDPTLKLIIGRLRPVVPDPIAHGGGNSFPSGHSLSSFIVYGALLLVFLPVVKKRWRPYAIALVALLIVAVGFSRIALGVHFVSDVVGAWCLGVAWLGVTGYAFQLWRRETGRPPVSPDDGLEPEARSGIRPGQVPADDNRSRGALVAELLVGIVLVYGALFALGLLVTKTHVTDHLGDISANRWFAAHRTPRLNKVSDYLATSGNTHAILAVGLVVTPILLFWTRTWRSVVFMLTLMFGELALFLGTAAVIQRPRPAVPHLEGHLPTSAFPSGHLAATICLYTGFVLLVWPRTHAWWRWPFLVAAVLMPIGVGWARLYRGMHHPWDLAGSVVLAAGWLTVCYLVIRPNANQPRAAAVAGIEDARSAHVVNENAQSADATRPVPARLAAGSRPVPPAVPGRR
jgi:membrane-associated phospholipid phosphatase